MGKSGSLPLAQPMKAMLAHFGMEWREAPGEAEAELACLNQEGLIDAIITDDCDGGPNPTDSCLCRLIKR
jgi:Holliday junction resolvase YEN1